MPLLPAIRQQIVLSIITIIEELNSLLAELTSHEFLPARRQPIPYHTSKLTGHQWVLELIAGNPNRIHHELGMKKEVFLRLIQELRQGGQRDSRRVMLEEQVAIFLYTCKTGLSVGHVGERFQRSSDTISRYFKQTLDIFARPPFYTTYVHFPADDSVPSKIRRNPKFHPYFRNAIGAIDGSHIPVAPPGNLRAAYRNRKGFLSQNGLFVADFDLKFIYTLCGWEGSAADAKVFNDAITTDLHIPVGKYLLADAGYALSPQLLVPYRGVRYHLAEWGRAAVRPQNKEELFNLRHASARNVVERIFGVMKARFKILLLATKFSLEVQSKIPAALCVIHNYIRIHDPMDEEDDDATTTDEDLENNGLGNHGNQADGGNTGEVEMLNEGAREMRDNIASAMWSDYMEIRRQRQLQLEVRDSESDASESDDGSNDDLY